MTGDNGQRYVVYYKDGGGKEHIAGWTDNPENITGMIAMHPSWHSPRVVDRKDYDESNR